MNRFLPFVLMAILACGGKGDNPIEPVVPRSDISSLQPGQFRVLAPADIRNGIELPNVPDAREFVIIVGNTSNLGDVVANYTVRGNLSAGGIEPELRVASSLQAPGELDAGAVDLVESPQQVLEKRVRGFERRALKFRGASAPWAASGPSFRRSTQAAAVPVVGEFLDVKIPDPNGPTNNLCNDFIRTRAQVAAVTARAILAVDTLDGPPLSLFTQADFDAIAAEFDNITYPTDEAWFGTPTDIDANQRVIILFTGEVNKLTPSGSTGFVGGFFFGGDFFPATAPPEGCPQSNQAEIFYLLAPDPTGKYNGNIRLTATVRQGTRGTIAHEFVHMINAGRRYTGGVARSFEVSWLDEGLAHMAEDAVGRRVRNFGDLQSLSQADIRPNPTDRNDYDAFFFQNMARLREWMEAPDSASGISSAADSSLAARGAAWALLRYSADHFSGGAPRTLMRALVAGPDTGLTNFRTATRTSLDTVLAGWLVANYADDLNNLPIVEARTQYRSYNIRSTLPPVSNGTYPLKVEPVGNAGSLMGTNRTGTGTYYRLAVAANAGAKNIKVEGPGGAVVSFPGAHVYVVRVR
ncbi:MAG: hypothetical protein M3365_07835 [Gemmatimonadota bacterium]|nr:hypothetical protein [Gemmatimonadota bacterium]